MNFHPTRNNLPSNAKTTTCSLLNARVADAIDLALITKQRIGACVGRHSSRSTRC